MLKSRCAMVEQVDFQHFDLVLVPTFRLKVWYHYWYQGIANFWLFLVCPKNKKPRNHYDFEVLIVFDFYLAEEEENEPCFFSLLINIIRVIKICTHQLTHHLTA